MKKAAAAPQAKTKTVPAMLLVLYEKVRSSQETKRICKVRSPKETNMCFIVLQCATYTVYTQQTLMPGNDTPAVS